MSNEPQGLSIEIVGLAQVAVFLGALYPAYYWVFRARSQNSMLQRAAIAGTCLLTAAIVAGLIERGD